MRRALLILALLPLLIAAKPNPIPPFAQQTDYLTKGPNTPPWCISEDDNHDRSWYGYMTGTFSTTEYFCDPTVDLWNGTYWSGGGDMGLIVIATTHGTLAQLKLSGQDRDGASWSQDAALTASEIVGTGKNAYVRNTYIACHWPFGDQGGGVLAGTQSMTVSGVFAEIRLQLVAEKAAFITTYHYPADCPAGQQPPPP